MGQAAADHVGTAATVSAGPPRGDPVRLGAAWRLRRLLAAATSPLVLLPSLAAVGIFVYGFIGFTFWVSVSNWSTLAEDLSIRDPVLGNYADIFRTTRFQADIRNTFIFTALFLVFAVAVGLGAAILLEQRIKGRRFFRNVILFPYAISMVVTGVVWRWMFNPEAGVNLLFDVTGFNTLLESVGIAELRPGWTTDHEVWFQVNGVVEQIVPFGDEIRVHLGIPAALIPVAIAASWQVAGFVMAMYIGGMATVPDSAREAARIDGASEWQIYRHVVIPMLRPVTITVLVILLHISLKTFDLVVAMAGPGPGFATDLPSLYVFETMFLATRYNAATAAAVVVLLFTIVVIVPYLVRTSRADR